MTKAGLIILLITGKNECDDSRLAKLGQIKKYHKKRYASYII